MNSLSLPAQGCDSRAMRLDRAPALAPDAPAIQPEQSRTEFPVPFRYRPCSGLWGRPNQLVSKEASDNPSFHKPPLLTNDSQSRRPSPQNQSLAPSWPCRDLRETPSSPWGCPHALPARAPPPQPRGSAGQPLLSRRVFLPSSFHLSIMSPPKPLPLGLAVKPQVGPAIIQPWLRAFL